MAFEDLVFLVLTVACFGLGAAILNRHPLSIPATKTTLYLWAGGLLFGFVSLVMLVELISRR